MTVVDLDQLAEEMFAEEQDMKKRLEEYRKVMRAPSKAAWVENLPLVSQDQAEKRMWVSTIEADASQEKSIKKTRLSEMYLNGPSQSSSLVLLKLLAEASKRAGVQLPRPFLLDIQKSGLSQRYQDMCNAE